MTMDDIIDVMLRATLEDLASQPLMQLKKNVESIKTSITDVVNTSLMKRGDFDFNKKMQFDIVAEGAQRAAKDIVSLEANVLSLNNMAARTKMSFTNAFANVKSGGAKNELQTLQTQWESLIASSKMQLKLGDLSGNKAVLENLNNEWGVMKNKMSNVVRETTRFKGELLSIMFFGMAITRVFGGFLRAAYQSFSTAVEGTDAANNSVQRLSAAWEFFKFGLIDALMNSGFFQWMIAGLIGIINWFGSLSETGRTWVVGLIAAAVVVGTIFTLIGLVGLGITGVSMTMGLLFGTTTLVNGDLVVTQGLIGGITANLITATGAASGLQLALGAGIVAGILVAIGWLVYLGVKMGGLNEVALSVVRAIARLFVILASAIGGAFSEAWNMIKMSWNALVDFFQSSINTVIGWVNKLISAINAITGSNISLIPTADFSGAKADVKAFGESFIDTYSNMLGAYLDFEQKYLSPKNGYLDGLNPANIGADVSAITNQLNPAQTPTSSGGNTVTTNITQNISGTSDAKATADEAIAQMNEKLTRMGLTQYVV